MREETRLHLIPRVFVLSACGGTKTLRLDDARAGKDPGPDGVVVGEARSRRFSFVLSKLRSDDDVFSSRKASSFHKSLTSAAQSCMIITSPGKPSTGSSVFSPLFTASFKKCRIFTFCYQTDASLDDSPGGRSQNPAWRWRQRGHQCPL